MKTCNFFAAALLGLATSFSASAQVAVPSATGTTVQTSPVGVSAPVGTGVIAPGQPGVSGALPSGAVVPGASTTSPIGTTSGTLTTSPTNGTLYSGASQTNTPAGSMSTTPGSTTSGSATRRTTTGRTSTTKARP